MMGIGSPSKISCVLSSSWYASQTRTIKLEKNTPFLFTSTHSFFQDMITLILSPLMRLSIKTRSSTISHNSLAILGCTNMRSGRLITMMCKQSPCPWALKPCMAIMAVYGCRSSSMSTLVWHCKALQSSGVSSMSNMLPLLKRSM